MSDPILVRLNFPLLKSGLMVDRAPTYLRLTCENIGKADRRWDALDQPDDIPRSDEMIIAARKMFTTAVHVDGVRDGKRFGEWRLTAEYEPCDPQPSEEIMRDNAKWQQWCQETYDAEIDREQMETR